LAESLSEASLAIASSGTVTLECALFRVPTVVIYKTSWLTYQIARRIITVKHIAMPNLLAGETVYPELIQNDAKPADLAREALEFLNNPSRVAVLKSKLSKAVESLGAPGASRRAAEAVLGMLPRP
jgi:lipid-A-disaccharide synthase